MRYTDPTGKAYKDGSADNSGCAAGYVYDTVAASASRGDDPCIPEMVDTLPPNWYPWDIGIVVGLSGTCSAGAAAVSGGVEYVIDLYDFETDVFGNIGGGAALGVSASAYMGLITGWSSFKSPGIEHYKGFAGGVGVSGTGGPIAVQGGVTGASPDGGRLWSFSAGGGIGDSAKLNGKFMQDALDALKKITPVLGSLNVATYFTAEDASKFSKAHFGVDLGLHSTTQIFHGPNHAHPTMQDAGSLSAHVTKLALLNPVFATLIPFVSIVSAYNATAWRMQDEWQQRHANAAK